MDICLLEFIPEEVLSIRITLDNRQYNFCHLISKNNVMKLEITIDHRRCYQIHIICKSTANAYLLKGQHFQYLHHKPANAFLSHSFHQLNFIATQKNAKIYIAKFVEKMLIQNMKTETAWAYCTSKALHRHRPSQSESGPCRQDYCYRQRLALQGTRLCHPPSPHASLFHSSPTR